MARRKPQEHDQPSLEAFWSDPPESLPITPPRAALPTRPPVQRTVVAAPSLFDDPLGASEQQAPTSTPEPPLGYSSGISASTRGSAAVFVPRGQGDLAPETPSARIAANLAALRVLRTVEGEQRSASAAEQAVLAQWGGWGASGVAQVFDESKPDHAGVREELHGLLSDKEYAAAAQTVINAHYTDAAIVSSMWRAVEGLGFSTGRVLEPGCGSGTFIGLAPTGADMTGVELDPVTAGIARLLYPHAHLRPESFADTRFPAGYFDLAIGNVPFANVVLHDPRYNSSRLAMHNHFIVKSLDLVRPGGLVAVLTSRYTMDAQNPAARREISARADLVAAVRLPSSALRRAAGTEAVADCLILRRREPETRPLSTSWERTTVVELESPTGYEATHINQYWVDHPHQVLGVQKLQVGMHGALGISVEGDPDRAATDLLEALQSPIAEAGQRGLVFRERAPEGAKQAAGWIAAAAGMIDGQVVAQDGGSFGVVTDGAVVELSIPKTQAVEVRALLRMRDEARRLIATEAADLDDTPELDQLRGDLAGHWREYVERYGPINRVALRATGRTDSQTGEPVQARVTPSAVRVLRGDPSAALLFGLEVYDEKTGAAEPAALLKHRVVLPRQPVRGVDNAVDGLAVVLDTTGQVDVDRISDLTGTTPHEVITELDGVIFQVPGTHEWQTRAQYLSGNVRTKLTQARTAELDEPGRWSDNVAALSDVLPQDVQAGELAPRVGAVWISAPDHEQFLRETLELRSVSVAHVPGLGWGVENAGWGVLSTEEWGTSRMDAGKIFEHLAQQRPITIFDTDSEGTRHYNPIESAAAIEKGRLLQERFAEWVWEDPERTDRLVTEYNRRFNSLVERDYAAEGARLTLPGLAKSFTPHDHQRAAVARMIAEPSVGLFHEVGAGKTAEMVIGLNELKRLGLVSKPAVVIPNHMLEQFSREWLQLYPQANILAINSEDVRADKRRRFVARAATGDWDAVIMTRSAFERIPLTPENQAAFLGDELEQLSAQLANAREGHGSSRTLKAMEKTLLRRQESLKAALDKPADHGVTFEETGIDYLCIDELHGYKNLATVSEIPDAAIAGSKRALDLYAKVQYLRRTNEGGRVLCGATATPLANSISEMHVMSRYLDPQGLIDAGVMHFDAWAATFGEVVTAPELSVAGAMKIKSRFARFNNLPELRMMFTKFADVKTAADLNLPRPAIATNPDGERTSKVVLVPASDELTTYMSGLGERAKAVELRAVLPTEDNMLKIGSDGRKAALDLRLVNPAYGPIPGGKLDVAADELHRVWLENRNNQYTDPGTGEPSAHKGGLQIVFCDLSTPSKDHWNAYAQLRDLLAARGMDPSRIRFIHEAKNDAEKARLFAACRSGGVDIIMGSTEKMGVGTNIQTRAVHLMNLDAPWRPADVEQRIGRAIRQGNQNAEVSLSHVVTESSFDTFMWQTLARKADFINQVMTGRGNARTAEGDVGGDVLPTNYSDIMAASSGNPLIFELAAAQRDVTRLRRLEQAHTKSQRSLAVRKRAAEAGAAKAEEAIPRLRAAVDATTPTAGDAFALVSQGKSYPTRDQAAQALTYGTHLRDEPEAIAILGGHTIMGRMFISRTTYDRVAEFTVAGAPEVSTRVNLEPGQRRLTFTTGTMIRLENMVERIPKRLQDAQLELAEHTQTITNCDRLLGRPFPQAEELAAARVRFAEITSLLETADGQPELNPTASPAAHQQANQLRAQANATRTPVDARAKLRSLAAQFDTETPAGGHAPQSRQDPTR